MLLFPIAAPSVLSTQNPNSSNSNNHKKKSRMKDNGETNERVDVTL